MKVPNHENAFVPPGKLIDYLLNLNHPDGNSKAYFFTQLGFDLSTLEIMLIAHIRGNDFGEIIPGKYGAKYVVSGLVESPLGVNFNLKSIWIIPINEFSPRLITAYPSK